MRLATSFLAILWAVLASSICLAADGEGDSQQQVQPRPSGGSGGKSGTFKDVKITARGKEREYRLVVPKSVDPEKPVPLVFAFHGFLIDSKDLMPVYTQLDKLAEDKGFILVYPNGLNRSWPLWAGAAKDDLALFDELYDNLGEKYNIDRSRVYLAGMSNGAFFSHLLATQRDDKIAAIVMHSGSLGLAGLLDPKAKHKYAVLVVHGTKDFIFPMEEAHKTRDAYKKWGHPVECIEVEDLNHIWAAKQGINEKIWEFFEKHPLEEEEKKEEK